MAAALGLIWLALLAVCVFAIFSPIAKLPVLNKRGGAIIAAIGVFILGGVLGMTMKSIDPQYAAQQAKEEANAKAEKEADAHPAPPTEAAQAQFLARHALFQKASLACDLATRSLGKTMAAGNQYDSYKATQAAAATCGQASTEIDAIAYEPPVAAHAQTELKAAMKACGHAYGVRAYAAREAGKAIDKGDFRPSTIDNTRDLFAAADSSVVKCVVGYMGAARKWGYKIPEAEKARGKS
jgi:hypothetical protein